MPNSIFKNILTINTFLIIFVVTAFTLFIGFKALAIEQSYKTSSRKLINIKEQNLKTNPGLVSVFLDKQPNATIVENASDKIIPGIEKAVYEYNTNKLSINEAQTDNDPSALVDKNRNTKSKLTFNNSGLYVIKIKSETPIKAKNINIEYDTNVTLPETIKIEVQNKDKELVLNEKKIERVGNVDFVETISDFWIITLRTNQPLVINEINIGENPSKLIGYDLLWLASNDTSYTVFIDPINQNFIAPTIDSLNYNAITNNDINKIENFTVLTNPNFQEGDSDKDGVVDSVDNCPITANTNQIDTNGNGVGDSCEDNDGDGIINALDNCAKYTNRNQTDIDKNGIGDVCEDADNDTIPDKIDNCPNKSNLEQSDLDYDKIGDVCDTNESRLFENSSLINGGIIILAIGVIGYLSYKNLKK